MKTATKSSSYVEIGEKLYGPLGKIFVELSLAGSQIGFVCAYVYFIMVNYNSICTEAFGVDIDRNYFALLCFFMFSMLCFVRKIEVFAATHIFADVMILLAIVTIVSYGSVEIKDHGLKSDVEFLNYKTFTDAIGFSVYAFEGIGMILPV